MILNPNYPETVFQKLIFGKRFPYILKEIQMPLLLFSTLKNFSNSGRMVKFTLPNTNP